MKSVSRYHPLLVMLHWVLAFLIIGALIVGFFGLAATPNAAPEKVGILRVHMAVGMLILFLTGIRFVIRLRTSAPAEATTGYRLLDRIAPLSHYAFYLLVLLMVGSGYTTGILAGLPAIVFVGSGAPLPATFIIYPSWVAHGYFATLLVGFIILHVVAACYHQFVRKDGLFRRMSFGWRVSHPYAPSSHGRIADTHRFGTSASASLRAAALFRMTDYWICAEGICSSRLTTLGSRLRALRKRSAQC